MYLRFALSFHDVKELLAERGITVTYVCISDNNTPVAPLHTIRSASRCIKGADHLEQMKKRRPWKVNSQGHPDHSLRKLECRYKQLHDLHSAVAVL